MSTPPARNGKLELVLARLLAWPCMLIAFNLASLAMLPCAGPTVLAHLQIVHGRRSSFILIALPTSVAAVPQYSRSIRFYTQSTVSQGSQVRQSNTYYRHYTSKDLCRASQPLHPR